ncbi:hypothetical protein PPL_09927 [Heterostelium album PN500]|uniref:Ribosomal protein L7Ae/L30e/S12e/Gadd45 domain-containing protein n=1 Tax=Heterostelium pallidum (strain ATCC 26659 / Pp 5 / PN500) TaxID=670386 RepID=D3BPR0_HETP5|nr:hypothetical protein PPL_09927 [Heterostelium album PN500]EFA76622.1 hypothetical protein PPL_09927 [Heterostelium album PN500]|eukprot:XP_020428754.1 hypothetical protein PPL_09927 [Heterostelium album PN500]
MVKNIAGNKPKPLVFRDTISSPYDTGDQFNVLDENVANQIVEELQSVYRDDLNIKMKKKSMAATLHKDILEFQHKLNTLYVKNKKCVANIKKRKRDTQSSKEEPVTSDTVLKEKENELQQIRNDMKPIKERVTTLTKQKKSAIKQLEEQLNKERQTPSIQPYIVKGINEITKSLEKLPITFKQQEQQQQQQLYDIKIIIICSQLASQGGNVMIEHIPMMATMRNIPYLILPNSCYNSLRSALGIHSLMAIAIRTPSSTETPQSLQKLLQLTNDAFNATKKLQFPLIGRPLSLLPTTNDNNNNNNSNSNNIKRRK